MTQRRTPVAVAGATGRQGGAVARALSARGWPVRALTRRTGSNEARALASLGIEPVSCDLGDQAAMETALTGVAGLFLTTTPYEAGASEEERQAAVAIHAARRVGVPQLVYSSVAGADMATGVAHFESKRRIERLLDGGFEALTVLRPAMFMEMLRTERFRAMLGRGRIEWMLSASTRIAMVSIDDIAAFAALAFEQPELLHGQRIELAGDQPNPTEIAAIISAGIGRSISYRQVASEAVTHDAMPRLSTQRWLEEAGWRIDPARLAATHRMPLISLVEWVGRHSADLNPID